MSLGLPKGARGKERAKCITYYFPRSLKLFFFFLARCGVPGLESQCWWWGVCEEKRIGNLLGVLHTLGIPALETHRQENCRLST